MAIPGNLLSATTEMVDPNTSGWAAKANCALSLASGGRNGDGCLKLTSVASGEMQARTFSSVPVDAGALYWTFADASSSAQPERIGIRWLDATGAEISVTWSLTTEAASASWHRVSVAGYAPVGTVRAQVLLSSTPAGAGVLHYWENVYLGPPIRLPGNLLSFNAEAGGEIDDSAWVAETNTTVSVIAPPSSWPADHYNAGGEQIAATAIAAGDASAECVERPPVIPGVEYVGLAYLGPPTTGSTVWVELRFYDEVDSLLEAHRSVLAPPGTGMYRQVTSGIAPAAAATAGVAVGITGATAGQRMRTEGVLVGAQSIIGAASLRTGNLLPKSDWDFEQGIGAWTVASGVATIARSSPWGAESRYNFYSLTATSSTATTSVLRSGIYSGITAGDNWRAETFFEVTGGGWQIAIAVRWYDEADTYLSSSTAITFDAPTPGWWLLVDDAVAPAGATQGQLEVTLTATSSSSVMQLDRPALWQTLPREEVAAVDEQAMVQLILRELSVGHLMTVWRVTPDGGRTLVRGPEGLYDGYSIPADSLVIEDYEAPLGVPVYYVIETVAVDDSAHSHKITDTVTLTAGDPNYAWLTDPARPGVGLQVAVKQAPEWQQAIEQTVYRVRGRATPVVLSDVRQSREGSLVCWTETDQQRDALRFLLSTGNVLLWRCAPGMGEPDVYVTVGEVQYPRIVTYAREEWREWTLPLTEVDMPTGGQVGSATWTVYDVVLEYATGYDVLDRYETVFDLAIDRRS
ncbi:hypothetical protein [Streptomyces sp. NPDC007063]|uniref:hypothetical protein n=1 Tax=Streptomyces sp. NPDC007063 TaxID=3364772 RepID=UPI00369A54A0